MNDQTAPEAVAEAIAPAPTLTPATQSTPVDVSEAARQLSAWRKNQKPAEPQAPPPAEPPQQLAETPNSDPPNEAPAETTEATDPAEVPPIDPPRSWTKDEKERFQSLPRETQEYIAKREQEREREIRRSQNEAAEKLKGLSAKEQQAEQARQQYEAALPALLQTLQSELFGEFSDVKTIEDINRLAAEDPGRFVKYQARQMQIASLQNEARQAQERQANEYRQKWIEFSSKEDALFAEKVPDIADPEKAKRITSAAVEVLNDIGFTEQELAKLWGGESNISLRDHRLQLLIHEAANLRAARKAAAKPLPKPVPNVQRPGSPPPKGAAQVATIEKLATDLSNAKGVEAARVAAKLLQAQRAAFR